LVITPALGAVTGSGSSGAATSKRTIGAFCESRLPTQLSPNSVAACEGDAPISESATTKAMTTRLGVLR
jgi:hypothetical protein